MCRGLNAAKRRQRAELRHRRCEQGPGEHHQPVSGDAAVLGGTSTGGTGQPLVALYVNTANPVPRILVAHEQQLWRNDRSQPVRAVHPGFRRGACSYMYGYAKAYDDANIRGISNAAAYMWWLDVETGNSWSTSTAANRADLEGMAAYFASIGALTGLYDQTQWTQIVGTVPSSSNLYTRPGWLAGANSLALAKRKCSEAPLTAGGKVTLTQYVSGGLDYDRSCI